MMKRPRLHRSFYVGMIAIAGLLTLSYFPLSRIRAANVRGTILPSAGKPLVNLKNPQNLKLTTRDRRPPHCRPAQPRPQPWPRRILTPMARPTLSPDTRLQTAASSPCFAATATPSLQLIPLFMSRP